MEEKQTQLKNNLTNDFTNTNLGHTYAKIKNMKTEEEKNNDHHHEIKNKNTKDIKNHEEILLRSKKYSTTNTIIEVKLPNPYLDTECVKYNRYIDYNIKSKFKSKFADYINNSKSNLSSIREIKSHNTYKISKKIDNHIYFTNLSNKKS